MQLTGRHLCRPACFSISKTSCRQFLTPPEVFSCPYWLVPLHFPDSGFMAGHPSGWMIVCSTSSVHRSSAIGPVSQRARRKSAGSVDAICSIVSSISRRISYWTVFISGCGSIRVESRRISCTPTHSRNSTPFCGIARRHNPSKDDRLRQHRLRKMPRANTKQMVDRTVAAERSPSSGSRRRIPPDNVRRRK